MLGAVVSQIGSVKPAENDTIVAEKTRGLDHPARPSEPSRRYARPWLRARPVNRHEDGDSDRDESTRSRNTGALQKDVWRVSIEKNHHQKKAGAG